MVTKQKQGIRLLAAQAKKRLKDGYWQGYVKERDETRTAALSRGQNPVDAEEYLRKKYVVSASSGASREDEALYNRVKAILENDENSLNPIGQLIDGDEYSTLDDASKQRYILRLSAKFKELSERYYKEMLLSK